MIEYEREFLSILQENEQLMMIVETVSELNLPDCWLAAGCIFQTIWNKLDRKILEHGLHDIDVIYFDPSISQEQSKL